MMLAKWGQLLRAIANGPDPARIPAPTEVIPTIDLSQPPYDWLYPQDVYLYGGYATEASLAGNRSQVALSNPAGSGVIATVEKVTARSDTTRVTLNMANAAAVAAFDSDGQEWGRDSRLLTNVTVPPTGRAPACKVLTDQSAQAGQVIITMFGLMYDGATYFTYVEDRIGAVLLPGSALVVCPAADEKVLYSSILWRERIYDPKETKGSVFV